MPGGLRKNSVGVRPGPARSGATSAAEEARSDELLRVNAPLPSDPALGSESTANQHAVLRRPAAAVRIRWEPRLAEVGPLIAEGFRLEGATDGKVILLNPSLEGDDAAVQAYSGP